MLVVAQHHARPLPRRQRLQRRQHGVPRRHLIGDVRGRLGRRQQRHRPLPPGTPAGAVDEQVHHDHPHVRLGGQAIIDAAETATVHSQVFDRAWPAAPHRALRNATVDAATSAPNEDRPGASDVLGADENGSAVYRYDDAEPVTGWRAGSRKCACTPARAAVW